MQRARKRTELDGAEKCDEDGECEASLADDINPVCVEGLNDACDDSSHRRVDSERPAARERSAPKKSKRERTTTHQGEMAK